MKILVLDGFALNPGDLSWKGIKELGTLVVYDRTEQARIISRIGDADVVVVNKCPISRETIEACPNLKLICVTATGYNTIDLEAAKEKGIVVCNVPTYATESVTQHVFAMLFAIPTASMNMLSLLRWENGRKHLTFPTARHRSLKLQTRPWVLWEWDASVRVLQE